MGIREIVAAYHKTQKQLGFRLTIPKPELKTVLRPEVEVGFRILCPISGTDPNYFGVGMSLVTSSPVFGAEVATIIWVTFFVLKSREKLAPLHQTHIRSQILRQARSCCYAPQDLRSGNSC